MDLTPQQMEVELRGYEGLIFSTAQRLVRSRPEQELEDVMQLLRMKAWRGLKAFDPAKARGLTKDRYLFMVIRDQAKDIAKKKRHGTLYIEDVAPSSSDEDAPSDRFHQRYLSQDHDQVYGGVDDGELALPNTLTDRERSVLTLMREDYRQTEIAVELRITKREVESAVRAIRTKLGDWRPSGDPEQLGHDSDGDAVPSLIA